MKPMADRDTEMETLFEALVRPKRHTPPATSNDSTDCLVLADRHAPAE